MALIDGHGKGNTQRTSEMRFGKTDDAPGPVLVRPMTDEERAKHGSPTVAHAGAAAPQKESDGYHLDDATREAIKQDLLAFVGQRTVVEKYQVPAQLVSYYRVQLQKQGLLTPPNGTSRTRRPTIKGDDDVARLSDDEKEALQADLLSRSLTQAQLAEKYGVAASTVFYYAQKVEEAFPNGSTAAPEPPPEPSIPQDELAPSTEAPQDPPAAEASDDPKIPSRQAVLADAFHDMQASLSTDFIDKSRAYEEAKMRIHAAELLRSYLTEKGMI